MPKIFIDTNVFLDFYKSRQESISILVELKKHSDHRG
jgi:predicted nucleic acid-binding protein